MNPTTPALHGPRLSGSIPTRRCLLAVIAPLSLMFSACGEPPAPSTDSAPSADTGSSAMVELLMDGEPLQEKILGMAEALNDDHYAWRPAEGVRSSGEVFMHIAAVNYAFPMIAGTPAPAEAEMTLEEFFPGIARFEGTATSRDEILATLRESFDHLERAMSATTDAMSRQVEIAGMQTSMQSFWWMHQGHLHEHLGQLIAYARSNGVAPPWS